MVMMDIPRRLLTRPRDVRGYPVPFVTYTKPDGRPDFAVLDEQRCKKAAEECLCGICGQRIRDNVYFIGGPLCEINQVFADPAMHRECAEFSIVTCPHIVNPKARYAHRKDMGHAEMEAVSDKRPDKFGIFEATDYHIVRIDGGMYMRAISPWVSVRWFREGQEIV